jgi:hypothetical protein
MWLYLKTGFYSVVDKTHLKEDELMVRAHSKLDIDRLRELLKTKYQYDGEVLDTPQAEYAYHMVVPRETFALFMSTAVNDLVDENFKRTTSWMATYQWQKDLRKEK